MKDLLEAALAVRENAYVPYSKFKVGAAVRTPEGIFSGCNVENAAYPEGTCAEAGAIAAMCAAGARKITEMVVVGEADEPVSPCGGCRQKIREFAAPDVVVILAGPEGERMRLTVADLLPASFGPEHLA